MLLTTSQFAALKLLSGFARLKIGNRNPTERSGKHRISTRSARALTFYKLARYSELYVGYIEITDTGRQYIQDREKTNNDADLHSKNDSHNLTERLLVAIAPACVPLASRPEDVGEIAVKIARSIVTAYMRDQQS